MTDRADPSDIALPAPDALVAAIMKRDADEPAYALLVVRGLIAAMPSADACTLVKYPKPLDPNALIG